ncbi:hypothetical protein [Nocardia vaccinii]|uniref:hypothetical protein n=1 Tax=Nocardia vaccinii TaxID=1822 RepID=UPI00082F3C78|nr:hypothetical protein [Nocardia vaccinii]
MTAAPGPEVVALISGRPSVRRIILEWAARHVGRTGTVHVVCDGMPEPLLTGSIALTGFVLDEGYREHVDFHRTATILAPHGCGWTWQYAALGAAGQALRRAKLAGVVAVLPRRSWMPRPPSIRVVRPEPR